MAKSITWRLRAGADRRFRSGHPWVYSNELAASPKGIEPGAPVELCDAGGKFLAHGFGNPHSLIAFRALSRRQEDVAAASAEFVGTRLLEAYQVRRSLGCVEASFRLCFGEADGLPGLIVDRYLLSGGEHQVIVLQAHTAGMDRILGSGPVILELCERWVREAATGVKWAQTAVVLRNDVGVRKLEGIEEQEARVLREISGVDLAQARILVASALAAAVPLEFLTDLQAGQKTGFFLDQASNIQLAVTRLASLRSAQHPAPLKILDLCSYVGQWSSQLARVYRAQGVQVDVAAVDASQGALDRARVNIEAQGARMETLKGDVLKCLGDIPDRTFDIVVSDPPALIKGRKDLPQGTHAYLQLATQAFRLVRPGGAVIACSCSALLDEESFLATLSKAARRGSVTVRWVGRGGHGPDHPVLAEFPEGRYLKAWIGITSVC